MAIRSGIGIGAAQIADTSNIMNAYGRQIAQQQKAQALQAEKEAKAAEKYNEELADIMASYKTTGARDIDIPEINAAYNQIKEYYSQSNKIKDSEKPLFKATIKNMMNTVNDTSLRSKELEGRTYTTASRIAQNPWDYDPKVIQDLDYVKKTPISKLGALANLDPSTYERLPNFGTIDKIMADVYEIGKNKADFIEQITENGQRFNVSRVDPAVIQDNLVLGLRSSPEAMKAISYRFSKQFGKQPTEQDLTNFMMDDYKTKYNLEYKGPPKDLQRPRGGGGAGDEQDKYTYRQQVITGALENDPSSINKIKAALPPGSTITPMTSKAIPGKSKGGYKFLKIYIPGQNDEYGNPLAELTQTIEASRGEGVIKLNRILNTYTGEKISDSKLGIKGGKPAGEQIAVNIPKSATQNPASEEDAIFELIKQKNVARGVKMTPENIKAIRNTAKENSNIRWEIDDKVYTYMEIAKKAKGSGLTADEYVKKQGGKMLSSATQNTKVKVKGTYAGLDKNGNPIFK